MKHIFTPHIKKLILSLGIILFYQNAFAQTKPISINIKEQPLSTVLKTIEDQTSYRVIYNIAKIDTNQKVSLVAINNSLEEVLSKLLKDTTLTYVIKNKQILLIEKQAAKPQKTTRIIKGIVYIAEDNLPLPGASILIKDSRIGAITNMDGQFTYLLKGNDIANIVLEVSYLGMKTKTVVVADQSQFTFYLEESRNTLEEVVITSSYGTKKLREEVVGSIETLNSKDIAIEQASESIDKMVDGQIAGVYIENTSGIGGPVSINIRGQGSLTPLNGAIYGTSTQPLIIIDGVIMAEEMAIDNDFFDANGSSSEDLSNPLSQISPENIESFTVLKDAAAVSIYGADAANGVILITTKQGKKGPAKFGFSSQLGVSSAINQIKYLSGSQYNELRNEYLKNTTVGYTPIAYNGVDTDWFNLLNGTGIYNKYNFSVSGASESFSYRTSLSFKKIDEPQKGNTNKQLNANINLGYKHKKFDLNLTLSPSFVSKNAPNIYYSYAFAPNLSPYNEDGSYANVGITGLGNPLAAIDQNKNISNTYSILGSLQASYHITEDLNISSLFGLSYSDKEQDRYFSGENESGQVNGSFTLNGTSYPIYGRRLINNRHTNKWNWQTRALYNKQIDENNAFDGIFGIELTKENVDFNYASGRGFVNPNIINEVTDALQDDAPSTTENESTGNQTYSSDISNNSKVSLFSQLNYNYKKRYFILANFRRDQSSVFGDDTNVAYTGGAGVSWILSNENFLEANNWIDLLKLKLSYGTTGNSRIGSYRSKGLYTINDNGYNNLDIAYPSAAPNGELSWEKNKKFNAGLNFNFLNTVSLTLEYYYDDIQDLITSRSIPSETGYNSIQINAASMYNKGLELSTNFKWFQKENFKWTTSFNISTLQSEVTELKGLGNEFSVSEIALAQKVGYSTSTIWGIKWAGIDPATGRDLLKKDGEIYDAITYNSLFTSADWVPIGDYQPDAYGGFNNTFTFNNNISLSIRGSFQIGGDYLAEDELIAKYNITSNRNLSVNAYDYWRTPGDVALNPIVTSNNPTISNYDKYLYDATSLRISNVNLNYSFPKNSLSFLDGLSVYTDVSNVLYWYKEKSLNGRNGISEFRFTYPQARTISIGVNAKF
ncbi:SusC/RagA family TonB-linked outer membrane protein [Polaribacter sp. R2A056_3_33]|uniref:SusC/RagA family TonB-linked outer membrane protein n=1 Tax=Polaribacter sp. R2A056_3_33 TaxID=2745563 RepID=UPI001C4EF091|nr:SusC/RagA family TonB-linked outer membrane protein [Polaribacter sp. R2A056_3_33]QXP71354.1 SusC/RagA family TonB-linked outer membrane protein [Polaribacter sp. R2A056_3_33]